MDFTKESINPNPRDRCSYLGILFFTYTWKIFKKGYTKVLKIEDLYNPIRSDRSTLLGDRLERVWNGLYEKFKETRKKPNLIWCLLRTFWIEYSLLGTVLVFAQFFAIVQPLMLGQLLSYFRPNSDMSKSDALWYAGAISLCTFTQALFSNQYLMMGFHYGMKVRAAACALIYRKSLRLSMTALGETAAGKIVNLLSNDVSRFDLVTIFLHYMWTAPLLTLVITYFMWIDVGWAGIVGIMTVFLIVPLQGYTGKLSAIYRKATALKTDERVRLMDEIISGIRVIKMYAWERPFDRLLKMARKSEVKIITKTSYVRGLYMAFNLFTTRVAMFTTLLTLTLTDYQALNASRVFLVLSYLNIVSQTMSQMFVRGISEIAELIVAIKRLEEFMLNEEFNNLKSFTTPAKNNNETIKLDVVNLTAKWNDTSTDNVLEAVTLRAHRGDLIGIIGPVGCGKSAILLSILGELNVVTGNIKIDGLVSYAAQESWVFAATVRQNILFGQEFDKNRYFDVVKACALERDFEQFSNGDLTIVGDRGASLSGGQKARINLARAIYRQADIYLLDDPLSAVDIHIGKHLYDHCINGFLANKTRILVTHQVDLLKNCQNIVILNNGRIENEGTFAALSQSDNLYAKLLLTNESFDQSDMSNAIVKRERKLSLKSVKSLASAMSELSIPESLLAETEPEIDEVDEPNHVSMERQIDMKNYHEESSKGKINGNLFWLYFSASGNLILAFIVLALFLLTEGAVMSADWFVSFWINYEDTRRQNTENQTFTEMTGVEEDNMSNGFWQPTTFLKFQGILVAIVLIFGLTRSLLFYKLAMISSQKLHDKLFKSVINAKMRFFDTNSTGRILNRFAKDIGSIDELLPKAILDASQLILLSIGSVILITIVNAYFLALVAVIGIFSLIFRHIYLKSSKNVKRLEGVMRSPVFTHLNATLNGLTTVRAFSAESILRQEFDRYQDGHTSAWFMFIALSSSFGLYMDLLCVAFVTAVTFSFLILTDVTGGQAGLAITQAMTLTMLVQWGLRQSAEVANQLMSVERVLEYAQLPGECDTQNNKLSKTWPENGKIHFQDTGLRYDKSDDSLVLKNLTFSVNACEKVGIVGRTGAGKSSLISALFRLADDLLGDICIDNVSTSDVPLSVLRSKISIIPQDPVLFSGTLRYNLDPFEQYADDVLYAAMREVELLSSAQQHGGMNDAVRLESHVMDGGANYSVGQRQLICLARAIIRQNKILLLDEATASVDPQTDALIQKTIRKKFANCTVLTVAHRLNTIMDSDKVLVMDQGQVVEFEHPHLLLQQPNGVFLNMVEETGQSMCAQLKKIAKESYLRCSTLLEENLKLEK